MIVYNIVIRIKQIYSYRLSISIDEVRAGMFKASLDHVGQVLNKSCLRVLSHSMQRLVIFKQTVAPTDDVILTYRYTTGLPVIIITRGPYSCDKDLILTYSVEYGSVKLLELEEPLILSVVLREKMPPRSSTSVCSPGNFQHMWWVLSSLRVMVMEALFT